MQVSSFGGNLAQGAPWILITLLTTRPDDYHFEKNSRRQNRHRWRHASFKNEITRRNRRDNFEMENRRIYFVDRRDGYNHECRDKSVITTTVEGRSEQKASQLVLAGRSCLFLISGGLSVLPVSQQASGTRVLTRSRPTVTCSDVRSDCWFPLSCPLRVTEWPVWREWSLQLRDDLSFDAGPCFPVKCSEKRMKGDGISVKIQVHVTPNSISSNTKFEFTLHLIQVDFTQNSSSRYTKFRLTLHKIPFHVTQNSSSRYMTFKLALHKIRVRVTRNSSSRCTKFNFTLH